MESQNEDDDDCFIMNTETSCSSLNEPCILTIVQDGRISSRVSSRINLENDTNDYDVKLTIDNTAKRKQLKALCVFVSLGVAIGGVVVLLETIFA